MFCNHEIDLSFANVSSLVDLVNYVKKKQPSVFLHKGLLFGVLLRAIYSIQAGCWDRRRQAVLRYLSGRTRFSNLCGRAGGFGA